MEVVVDPELDLEVEQYAHELYEFIEYLREQQLNTNFPYLPVIELQSLVIPCEHSI